MRRGDVLERVPGELPIDGTTLARDLGPCAVCGELELLEAGEDVCPPCHALGRAAALRRRPRNPVDACRTTGERSAAIASPAGAGSAEEGRL